MSVNFFDSNCQTKVVGSKFGICDDQNNKPAYIDTNDSEKWVAIVKNSLKKEVTFTAIDNCIPIYQDNGDMDSRCDGMLTYIDNIIFVELKKVRKNWVKKGISQLGSTIEIFKSNHDMNKYKKQRAFLTNKKHPNFQHSLNGKMQMFTSQTGVRLIVCNTINL